MMRWFRDLPIYQKLVVTLFVTSGISLVLTSTAVLVYEVTSFKPRKKDEAKSQAELISRNLEASLAFDNLQEITETLGLLGRDPTLQFACVYRFNDLERVEELYTEWSRVEGGEANCPKQPRLWTQFQGDVLHLSQEILLEGQSLGTLYLQHHLPPLSQRLPQYGFMVLAILVALLLLSLLLALVLQRVFTRPILELAAAAGRVTESKDYSVQVEPRGHDEIGNLTTAFNRMLSTIEQREMALRQASTEQKRLQEQLIQAQKMESIGRLAGGVAHDFNNLLTVIVGCTDLAFSRMHDSQAISPLLANIRNATTQATNLTNRLLAFARRQIIEPRVISLNELVLDAEKMLRTLIGDDVELLAIPRADLWSVKADASQMMQVLVNLAVNGRDAMPQGGKLTIETSNLLLSEERASRHPEAGPGEYVVLKVADTGMGMSDEVKAHLFEPFYTTKERGKGTGLGLAMCYGIVKQSGGFITFTSEPGQGTAFQVFLPRATDEPETVRRDRRPAPLPAGQETLLVVEDNALVRSTTVELLRAQGYTVLEAAGGPDAVRLVQETEKVIDLLVTDVVMPEMSGKDVAIRLKELRPTIRVLYVSGYTADEIDHRGALEGGIAFLQKPYTSETLIRKVRSVLDVREESGIFEVGSGGVLRPEGGPRRD